MRRSTKPCKSGLAARLLEQMAKADSSSPLIAAGLLLVAGAVAIVFLAGSSTESETITRLESGEDSPTGEPFKLGSGGDLESHSSERTKLIDAIAAEDLAAAGEYARELLDRGTADSNADEWALSLRNYARANPGDGAFAYLKSKLRDMIADEDWRTKPSVGFLEAFDVFVYTRDIDAVPLLSELAGQSEDRGLAHAAFLTLDRLVIAEPEAMFEALAKQEELHQTRGEMVANLFARADLRVPAERAAAERYLLDPSRRPDELAAFAGVYPNANRMVSNNLLTPNETPEEGAIAAHDREALEIVRGWLSEARFNPVREHVQTMFNRLRTFVNQAGGS